MVKVRFAPSPTGFLHLGGARTALFNWLFARAQGGKFVLRIEDTDKQRSEERFLEDILDSLKWLGLDWDEGPYFQSKREEMYKEYAKKLLDAGLAYYDQPGETEALRFKVPASEEVTFSDIIRGDITFNTEQFDDLVIVKSDGSPTYNFACVVDDATMGITHIVRGEDHISNTPKQVLLYRALGFDVPAFAHLPLILAADRSRLSKRHGAVSVTEYRNEGILAEALFNYLALLGWSPKDDSELLRRKDIIEKFRLEDINKTGATFDIDKLGWMNGQYIMKFTDEELLDKLMPLMRDAGYIKEDGQFEQQRLLKVVNMFKERIKTLPEFIEQVDFVFFGDLLYNNDAVEKHLKKENVRVYLTELADRLEAIEGFAEGDIETVIRGYVEEKGAKAKFIMQPIRVAITGKTASPGLFEVILILGKEKTVQRMRYAAEKLCL